jgi:hypothetical protein
MKGISNSASEITKFVRDIKSDKLLEVLFSHYQSIIDAVKIATLNDTVWFFIIKDEIKRRKDEG